MAHMDRISMGDMYEVHEIRIQARARAPDLVLPPQETPGRYASMAQKEAIGASVRACALESRQLYMLNNNVQGIQTRWHLLTRAGDEPHLGAY